MKIGKNEGVCSKCRGSGQQQIINRDTDPPDTWLDDCHTCHGTGKVAQVAWHGTADHFKNNTGREK